MFVISFLVYFDKKVHKKLKKKIKQATKFQTLDFAESNAHRKTNARGSFETYDLFFLALYIKTEFANCVPVWGFSKSRILHEYLLFWFPKFIIFCLNS